jgi:hypothetical protein
MVICRCNRRYNRWMRSVQWLSSPCVAYSVLLIERSKPWCGSDRCFKKEESWFRHPELAKDDGSEKNIERSRTGIWRFRIRHQVWLGGRKWQLAVSINDGLIDLQLDQLRRDIGV